MEFKFEEFTNLNALQKEMNPNFGFTDIGGVVSALLPLIYSIAGIVVLFYLVMGGLGLMTSAGDPKKVESSKQKITNAIIGIVIIFASYWIIQLVSTLLGIEKFNIFK